MMKIGIVDYGSGNLRSVAKALAHAASEINAPWQVTIVEHARELLTLDRIVLPGVGAFQDCKAGLDRSPGLREALEEAVLDKKRPFLGICVGMQLLASDSEENEFCQGLGWIEGHVRAIPQAAQGQPLKIPHMGWNTLQVSHTHPLFDKIPLGEEGYHAYFVHSYHFIPKNPAHILLSTFYGIPLVAMVGRDHIFGTQFHPEKSQKLGLDLLSAFLRWYP